MKPMKRCLVLVLAVWMCISLLTACGEVQEQEVFTLRVALCGTPATLDPALVQTTTENVLAAHLYENLMKTSAEGTVNAQAKSYTVTENQDGTQTYVFTLRDDICWSDGRTVTAEDYVYAWNRLADPDTGAPNAAILNTVDGYTDAAAGVDGALGVWADEEGNFVVTLSAPDPYFLSTVCTAVATCPVREDAAEEESRGLLTNGAYVPEQQSDGSMILTACADYYDSVHLGPGKIEFTFTDTEEQAAQLYSDGRVDFAAGAAYAEDSTTVELPQVGVIMVNQMASTLSREEVRQALNLTIDRNEIAEALGEKYIAADGIIPGGIKTMAGESFRTCNGPVVDNNPEDAEATLNTAKELVSGTAAGGILHRITLLYDNGATTTRVATLLQKNWKEKLGIDVTLQGVSTEEFESTLQNGEFSMALVVLTTGRNDASSLLHAWQSTDPRNYGQYYSNAFELLLSAAACSESVEAHDAYLEDAERLLVDSGYAMPLCVSTSSYLLREGLNGLYDNGLGTFYFHHIVEVPTP